MSHGIILGFWWVGELQQNTIWNIMMGFPMGIHWIIYYWYSITYDTWEYTWIMLIGSK